MNAFRSFGLDMRQIHRNPQYFIPGENGSILTLIFTWFQLFLQWIVRTVGCSSSSQYLNNNNNNMQFLTSYIARALYPPRSSKHITYYYPSTPVHTNTFLTPQRSIQPRYKLQGAAGDQCTMAFSVYCQVLIYLRLSEAEHMSGTNLAQGL